MKKIVVIGPESSGKSTLCQDLSAYFKSSYLPEYARIYLENNGSQYTYQDVLKITAEPACAAALAALVGPAKDIAFRKRVGLIACGSNISMDRYNRILNNVKN